MRWSLVVTFLLLASQVHAQDAQQWHDPYAFELAQLRAQRPSMFWPNALIIGGSASIVMGGALYLDSPAAARADRISTLIPTMLGAAAIAGGIVFRIHQKRERQLFDARIAELSIARAALPRVPVPPPLPRVLVAPEREAIARIDAKQPPLTGPIALLSSGIGVAAVGAVTLYAGLLMTTGRSHAEPWRVATAGGSLVVAGAGAALAGIILLHEARAARRDDQRRSRELEHSRVDYSLAPFLIRW